MRRERLRELIRASWMDIAWVAFVGLKPGIVKTLCDPACGTGGMLSVAEDHNE